MSTGTDFIIKVLKVVSWIIFIGLCIQTGTFLFNYLFGLINPDAMDKLYLDLGLVELHEQSFTNYSFIFSFLVFISALKAYVFYQVIIIFMKLNLVKPFSEEISILVTRIGYYILGIGVLGMMAHQYTKRLTQDGFNMGVVDRYWNDNSAFLMMAAILFVISHVFKKGIELQKENELTI